MWSLFDSPVLIPTLLVLITAAVIYYKRQYYYWASRGVLQLPQKFLYGNEELDKSLYDTHKDLYTVFKAAGVKFGGINVFSVPKLIVVDLDLIKRIMVKDFDHFVDRHNVHFVTDKDPLNNNLFNMLGDAWKAMRVKLSPTFTSGKMKGMFQTITDTTKGLNKLFSESARTKTPANIKDILERFTTDSIGSCAFGLECNSLKTPDSDFRKFGRKIFEITTSEKIKFILMDILPTQICLLLNLKVTRSDVEAFFMNTVKEIIDYREKHQVFRKDFVHLMLQLKNRGALHDDEKITNENANGKHGKTLTFEEFAAQCFVFFAAGFETSSTLMSFTLLELSQHQEIQSKLREEIERVLKKHDNQLTYESIAEMKYLECVLQESLRKYPPVPFLDRKCTKAYEIPGTTIVLEEGTKIIIPIAGIQMDEEYFPNPEKFDPDRFNEEHKSNIPNYAHMPFGEGPRNCIGMRFGLLQAKVGIITVLRNFNVTLSEKMKLPFNFDPMSQSIAVEGGIWLNVDKL